MQQGPAAALTQSNAVRVLDLLIVRRNADGAVQASEFPRAPGEVGPLRAGRTDLAILLAEEDLEEIARWVKPGASAVAVAPSRPDTVYVGASNGAGAGLYRSTDAGEHWDLVALGGHGVASIVIGHGDRMELMRRASAALYLAKTMGRNRVVADQPEAPAISGR